MKIYIIKGKAYTTTKGMCSDCPFHKEPWCELIPFVKKGKSYKFFSSCPVPGADTCFKKLEGGV